MRNETTVRRAGSRADTKEGKIKANLVSQDMLYMTLS